MCSAFTNSFLGLYYEALISYYFYVYKPKCVCECTKSDVKAEAKNSRISSLERVDDCGLLVTAKSVENFKSLKVNESIKFWIKKESDIFPDINRYFVILYDSNKGNLCHDTSIMGANGYQSVFPIYEDPENNYILASRSSFLSAMDGRTYASNNDMTGNVRKIEVINNRIYAFGKWEAIKSLIIEIVKHED
ncbi:hypothetical protein CA267_010860 [Alteromonas pelagimontana]|uniref:Uncharacterized protein n=1 Tax=Alteromonas pelagimontana TaxID=1858656 RepID=A0A6M4MGB1_9ALTE|nr:hypothetical protein [Alteromonas pelagimontana]QJR81246.1 hypothetical protein CA267_010860 [Alteromonas pelagimontana]